MKLSALLLTLVIAFGATADAKTKYKPPKPPKTHAAKTYKSPKVKHKPAKLKPMKFHKAKRSTKPPKAHKTPRSV
jgi:hypothetical protein